MTEEERATRLAQLAKGRETARANRAARIEQLRSGKASEAPAKPRDKVIAGFREAVEHAKGEPDDDARVARRQRLLGDVAPEIAALFTDAELDKIEAEERERAKDEQKKQALTDVRAAARRNARVDYDLIPASTLRSEDERKRLAEPVAFTVRLPGDGAGHRGQAGFRVDGELFQNGRTYTRSRAVFESLQSNHYRVHLNEVRFRTLDQHKPGGSAEEVLSRTMPQFEVA